MTEQGSPHFEAPTENFNRGLRSVELPHEFGSIQRGKVRDNWVVDASNATYRVLVTTDRQSAYDSVVGTIPGKGQVLNLLSRYWFEKTRDIVPNHMVDVPHPNVLIAKEAEETFPVEFIVRGYMAKSSTTTSIYRQYMEGKREIYGMSFPEGLKANEKLPMGAILTPTTKADAGMHDEILTNDQAAEIVDSKLGKGMYEKASEKALELFKYGSEVSLAHDLLVADTKFEFGVDENGELMVIDEVLTPDSSRFWKASTYEDRVSEGKDPEIFDKEILRKWLAEHGFTGEPGQLIPRIDSNVIDQMSQAYQQPFEMLTGSEITPYLSMSGLISFSAQQALSRLS
jgi:phosphoribosylaminoimidazole-succinocarboxamide synthase